MPRFLKCHIKGFEIKFANFTIKKKESTFHLSSGWLILFQVWNYVVYNGICKDAYLISTNGSNPVK